MMSCGKVSKSTAKSKGEKSMKKKILALLLAAAATVSLLSGCGADSGVMDTAHNFPDATEISMENKNNATV